MHLKAMLLAITTAAALSVSTASGAAVTPLTFAESGQLHCINPGNQVHQLTLEPHFLWVCSARFENQIDGGS